MHHLGFPCGKGNARAQGPSLVGQVEPVLALCRAPVGLRASRAPDRGMAGACPLPVPGARRDLAARACELCRTLWSRPKAARERTVRARPSAPQLERCAKGLELASDQPSAPRRSSRETRPPVSAPSDSRFRGVTATSPRVSAYHSHGACSASVAEGPESSYSEMAGDVLSGNHPLDAGRHPDGLTSSSLVAGNREGTADQPTSRRAALTARSA